ncbi:gliding motility-associated C-terminal domain-containing protein [Dyadobacter sp. CY261]|uniref:gliding motility-associated C-terminal domain-containing protein n=1 Tax=Dyadobacter sp. CY261 TaxID=2907203 RepID=UPI001F1C194F|nr:gliding motility-associated C-terminal domain-containing protein [Dyadobacter sp. CY261]MCF0074110.1 gliding motility-associated C-terminal domain-containing protein [Dyadobacter sp. CY261]
MASYLYRQIFLILVLLMKPGQVFGQNLLPDPGFENYKAKPCGIISTDSGVGIEDYLVHWRSPTAGSSDLWYADTTLACYSNIFLGTKAVPRNGKFCAGIHTSQAMFNTYQDLDKVQEYREYLQTRLIRPLTKGKAYYLEYYVQRQFSSSLATSGFGGLLSTQSVGKVTAGKYPVLRFDPQIISSEIVTDTAKWTKISGCFIAGDNFEYLTIGNFLDDRHTAFATTYYKASEPYYLIDDVSLKELDIASIPKAGFLGDDLTICEGQNQTYALDSISPFTLKWQDGSTQTPYKIESAGTYYASLTYEGCSIRDTVKIDVIPKVNLGPDMKACQLETVTLETSTREKLLWQDQTEASQFTVKQSGFFVAISLSQQCPSQDTIKVDFYDCPGKIPNVFTPNDDGKNDFFVIDNVSLSSWGLEIYNRWGKRVYANPNYDNSWNGKNLSSGQYYYHLNNTLLNRSIKGWVNLLR